LQTQPIQYLGTGRRKLAVARVFLRHGTGTILVNRRPMEEYFPGEMQRSMVKQPLQLTETLGKFDILITAHGGEIGRAHV